MIGFAQGREPGVSRRVIATFESIVNAQIISLSSSAVSSTVSSFNSNCVKNLDEASCNFLSLCASFDNEIEVLEFVGSLKASAQISQSAWSQWNVVRQIIATTQKRYDFDFEFNFDWFGFRAYFLITISFGDVYFAGGH